MAKNRLDMTDEHLKNRRYIRAFKLRILELNTPTLEEYLKAVKEELRLRKERSDEIAKIHEERVKELKNGN